MSKKQHYSARGIAVNFDELTRKNSQVIAVGNAKMNARGDRLGKGGKIIRKVEDVPKDKMVGPDAPYNTKVAKAIKLVSLKDNLATGDPKGKELASQAKPEDAKSPQEVLKAMTSRSSSKSSSNTNKSSSNKNDDENKIEEEAKEEKTSSKRKIVDSED